MDRIDLHVEVPAVAYRDLSDSRETESSAAIADLAGSAIIREPHLAEAIQYRSLDRKML